MVNINSQKNQLSEIDSIEKEINENILNSDVFDIVEVTYAYKSLDDWSNWNTTLFNKLLWEDEDIEIFIHECGNNAKNKALSFVSKKAQSKLENKILDIDKYIQKLLNQINLSEDENIKAELLISSLKYARNSIEMALVWLPFELEKAWLKLNLNDIEVEEKINKLNELSSKNFWGQISENPEEMELVYNFMKWNYEDNKWNLSRKEKQDYKKYLKTILDKILETNKDFKHTKPKEKITHPSLELKMNRDEYKEIFKAIPTILGSNKEVEISNDYLSFYDWEKWFIPWVDDYKEKSLEYILSTGVHEALHLITEIEWEKNVWWAKWSWYLEREEWLAVYLEYLIKWEENLVWLWEPRLLVWELYEWKENERFIYLHNKLNPSRKSWNILRNKRNYPMNYKWVPGKDYSYWKWLRQIHKIMKWNTSKKKYLIWKMNFDFIEKHWDKYKAKIPDSVLYPFIMWEMLKFYAIKYYDSKQNIASNKNWEYKFSGKDFEQYMNTKYSHLDLSEFQIANNEFFWRKEELWGIRIWAIINQSKKRIKKIVDTEFKKAA